MDGGCIDIWRKEPLDIASRNILKKYAVGVGRQVSGFSIRFQSFKKTNWYEKRQLKAVFGKIPKEEIVICGFADPIFLAAEEILKFFGGYLKMGIDDDDKEAHAAKGQIIKIYKSFLKHNNRGNSSYTLVNYEFTANYINSNRIEPSLRSLFNIDDYTIKI